MTLLFCDSFDHYAVGDIAKKWELVSGANWFAIQSGGGRNGSNSVRWNSSGFNPAIGKSLGNLATVIAGVAASFPAAPSADFDIIQLREGGQIQTGLRLGASGRLFVHRGGTLLGAAPSALPTGYNYLEMKATIDDTAGAVEVRVNGATVIALTGVDTKATGNAWADALWIGPITSGGGGAPDFDDFYLCDTSGSVNNTFLGDVRIECLFPTGAGAATQFTPSTGANYAAVDEASANTSDYVTSTADDQIDLYAFGDLAETSGSVKAVQITALAQKTSSGSKSLALLDRTNSANHAGADRALATGWQMLSDVRETDAGNGGVAWSIANVNAAQFGIKSRP